MHFAPGIKTKWKIVKKVRIGKMTNMTNIWILAAAENGDEQIVGMEETTQENQAVTQQDGGSGASQQDGAPVAPQKPNPMFLLVMGILVVYMFFVMFRGPKKKQQEHQKMVAALAKNDRVRTIGGIFGTVLDVRDDEIVLKIDESNNTKMRISPAAIATVLKDTKNQ